jgi:hypothetical protein
MVSEKVNAYEKALIFPFFLTSFRALGKVYIPFHLTRGNTENR